MKPRPALFVYGTLMTGHLRESVWPHAPVSVEAAWVMGELYDLGPYPALVPSVGCRCAGQLWTFEPGHWQATLNALDRVEGYDELYPDGSLYLRVAIECTLIAEEPGQSGHSLPTRSCQTYIHPGTPPPSARRIPPGADGLARWTRTRDEEG